MSSKNEWKWMANPDCEDCEGTGAVEVPTLRADGEVTYTMFPCHCTVEDDVDSGTMFPKGS